MKPRPFSERGQAAAELIIVFPVLLIFIAGVLLFGQLVYTHLAVMTAANDCATTAAQATNPYNGIAQGNEARVRSLSSFYVSQEVTTAGLVSVANQSSRGVTTPARYICQVGYPLDDALAHLLPGQVFPAAAYQLEYRFTIHGQPYKSDWSDVP